MANIKIENIKNFKVVVDDNREFDFTANVVYRHGKRLKMARLNLCFSSRTASLSKDQHTHKPFEHKNRLLALVEIEMGWR